MDMKIENVQAATVNAVNNVKDKDINTDFEFTLNKVEDDGFNEKLKKLMDDITLQGKKLADHMDVKDMRMYRTMVTEFINQVVSRSHKFSRENFLDKRGRHRVYGIVKLVNKDLDELAQSLIQKEKNHLSILEKIDEIKGLLLDIIM